LGENKVTNTSVKILLIQTDTGQASWYAISELHNFLKSKIVKEIFFNAHHFFFLREWKRSEMEVDEEYCWAIT
jgi:hypothetical protein